MSDSEKYRCVEFFSEKISNFYRHVREISSSPRPYFKNLRTSMSYPPHSESLYLHEHLLKYSNNNNNNNDEEDWEKISLLDDYSKNTSEDLCAGACNTKPDSDEYEPLLLKSEPMFGQYGPLFSEKDICYQHQAPLDDDNDDFDIINDELVVEDEIAGNFQQYEPLIFHKRKLNPVYEQVSLLLSGKLQKSMNFYDTTGLSIRTRL